MTYSDREIEALAQWAMSPDPVNWELFNSQPLEERLRVFDWWWERWEYMDFKVSNNSGCNLVGYSMAWLESYYTFIDITIVLNIGILTLFSVGVMGLLNLKFSEIKNTDDLPLDRIKADIYKAIKNYITQ